MPYRTFSGRHLIGISDSCQEEFPIKNIESKWNTLKIPFFLLKILTTKKILNVVLWLLSIVILGLIIFGVHSNYTPNPLPRWFNIIYSAMARIVWSLGVGFIIFACSTSNGGEENDFFRVLCFTPYTKKWTN